MGHNATYTYDNKAGDILKDFHQVSVYAFLKKTERILVHFMPPQHWNAHYTKEDFAQQLVSIACHGDFISNGSRVYNLVHAGPSGDTLLYSLHNLTMEDVQGLYESAIGELLHLAKKNGIYRRFNVQLAVDFAGKLFYGDHEDEWIWKMKKSGKWERMYRWILVSLVDRDQKYPLYIEPAPASAGKAKEMAELLTSVLEKVLTIYNIFSGRLVMDREFFNVETINALQDFCRFRRIYWLMPARRTGRVKKRLDSGQEGIFPFSMKNKKRERASFILALAQNEEGELHPFATNIRIKSPRRLYQIYQRRWQIETNIRSTKHPFLINTTSINMPTRDYLMRFAVLCCFAWMLVNASMIEDDFDHWITIHMFIVLLFNKLIDENLENLEKAFRKAPLSACTRRAKALLRLCQFFVLSPESRVYCHKKTILHSSRTLTKREQVMQPLEKEK